MNCHYCNKPIENHKRSSKRYCNDTCKQYAYLKRRYMQPNGLGNVHSESIPIITEPQNNETKNEITEEKTENANNGEKPVFSSKVNYRKIRPSIIKQLNEVDFSGYEKYFSSEGRLTPQDFRHFVFLLPRIRSIIENILTLHHKRAVHYKTVNFLYRAMVKTFSSDHYRILVKYGDFPFTKDLSRLFLQFQKLSQALRTNKEGIKLFIDNPSLLRYIIMLKAVRDRSSNRGSFRVLFPELFEPQNIANKAPVA